MILSVNNQYSETGREDFLSSTRIRDIASAVLEEALSFEGFPYEAEVSLLITTDDEIRILNQEFRGIDESTDVLSFPSAEFDTPGAYEELSAIDELFDPDTEAFMLGDIVVSAEHCLRQAHMYAHSIERELAFLIAHSILHLIGYDHMDEAESAEMEERQEEILRRAGYPG